MKLLCCVIQAVVTGMQFAPAVVLSTDDYFERNGEYEYDAAALPQAHRWNQQRTLVRRISSIEITDIPHGMQEALRSGRFACVIVDNTHLRVWDMHPYYQMGAQLGWNVTIAEPDTPWRCDDAMQPTRHHTHREDPLELALRNQHGVALEKIKLLLSKFDRHVTVADIAAHVPRDHTPAATPAPPQGAALNKAPSVSPGACDARPGRTTRPAFHHGQSGHYDADGAFIKDPQHTPVWHDLPNVALK